MDTTQTKETKVKTATFEEKYEAAEKLFFPYQPGNAFVSVILPLFAISAAILLTVGIALTRIDIWWPILWGLVFGFFMYTRDNFIVAKTASEAEAAAAAKAASAQEDGLEVEVINDDANAFDYLKYVKAASNLMIGTGVIYIGLTLLQVRLGLGGLNLLYWFAAGAFIGFAALPKFEITEGEKVGDIDTAIAVIDAPVLAKNAALNLFYTIVNFVSGVYVKVEAFVAYIIAKVRSFQS